MTMICDSSGHGVVIGINGVGVSVLVWIATFLCSSMPGGGGLLTAIAFQNTAFLNSSTTTQPNRPQRLQFKTLQQVGLLCGPAYRRVKICVDLASLAFNMDSLSTSRAGLDDMAAHITFAIWVMCSSLGWRPSPSFPYWWFHFFFPDCQLWMVWSTFGDFQCVALFSVEMYLLKMSTVSSIMNCMGWMCWMPLNFPSDIPYSGTMIMWTCGFSKLAFHIILWQVLISLFVADTGFVSATLTVLGFVYFNNIVKSFIPAWRYANFRWGCFSRLLTIPRLPGIGWLPYSFD